MFNYKYENEKLLKDEVTEEQLTELYNEYMETYHDSFPDWILELMNNDYKDGLDGLMASCYTMQFYDEYNLMKDKFNPYLGFIEMIKHNHPDLSDKTILDVGAGIVPSIGKRLAKEAKHVITIDRYMAKNNNPNNLEAIEMEIESSDQLPKADLIIGFMPCEAENYLIEHASKTNTDFIFEQCGCIHDEELRKYLSFYSSYYGMVLSTYMNRRKDYYKDMIKKYNLGSYSELGCSVPMPFKVVGNRRIIEQKKRA